MLVLSLSMRVIAGDTVRPHFSTNGSLMILGTHMLPGIAGLLGGRLPGSWWIPGAKILEACKLMESF